jgi:hypothetical protein
MKTSLIFESGFGFLASAEVKKAGVGNIGLHDRQCSYFLLRLSNSLNDFIRT